MTEPVDPEIDAIKAVLSALSPLSEKARASVLDYVTRRLDLPARLAPVEVAARADALPTGAPTSTPVSDASVPHIKQFKQEKNPRSANEMAAVVAYYLANVAAAAQRKATVNQADIETYFKIASFPLPRTLRVTLPNAKNAGYFDLAGEGQYRLNAVGHNLVAHGMPRGKAKAGAIAPRKAKRRRATGRVTKKARPGR
jgi:hypothetical protein